jgi:hypothetical protein
MAEIYDADTGSSTAYLANLSARANVGTGGNILIAGFVVAGDQPVTVLLRGVGPTLSQAPFSVSDALTATSIGLYDSTSVLIASNTGWGNNTVPGTSTAAVTVRPATASDMSGAGAFSIPASSADSAMVATLPAGSYTLELSGPGAAPGIGLVEVYLLQ